MTDSDTAVDPDSFDVADRTPGEDARLEKIAEVDPTSIPAVIRNEQQRRGLITLQPQAREVGPPHRDDLLPEKWREEFARQVTGDRAELIRFVRARCRSLAADLSLVLPPGDGLDRALSALHRAQTGAVVELQGEAGVPSSP